VHIAKMEWCMRAVEQQQVNNTSGGWLVARSSVFLAHLNVRSFYIVHNLTKKTLVPPFFPSFFGWLSLEGRLKL